MEFKNLASLVALAGSLPVELDADIDKLEVLLVEILRGQV